MFRESIKTYSAKYVGECLILNPNNADLKNITNFADEADDEMYYEFRCIMKRIY